MKAILYSEKGEKKSDVTLPELFNSVIREDLAQKYLEAEKFALRQPYANYEEAGRRHSASGTISHKRHEWKGHYGKGMARLPRKTMWRRGTQFYWIGAEVSGTRGGRKVHSPLGIYAFRKINKKERTLAFNSALASSFNPLFITKRYSSLEKPLNSAVIESFPSKAKDIIASLEKIFPGFSFLKEKSVRSGKGKNRSRKYKSNAGLLIITGNKEKLKISGMDVKSVDEIKMHDLFPLGRLSIYTKQAIEEIGGKK